MPLPLFRSCLACLWRVCLALALPGNCFTGLAPSSRVFLRKSDKQDEVAAVMEKAKKKDAKEVVSCLGSWSCPGRLLLCLVFVVSCPPSCCLVFALSSCCPCLVSVVSVWRVLSYLCLRLRLCPVVALSLSFLCLSLSLSCVSCRARRRKKNFPKKTRS